MVSSVDSLKVCKLHKALYGLKQAPRAWFDRLSLFLQSLGFIKAKSDPSLLIYNNNDISCYMLVYVDDIVITGNSSTFIDKLIQTLDQQFSLKDLGLLNYFLGVEVSRLPCGGLFLSQQKYILDSTA